MAVDAALVADWLAARSLARGLPPPLPDRGGLRVDVGSDAEVSRWVFAEPSAAITALTQAVRLPGHLVKLAGTRDVLRPLLADGWRIQEENSLMMRGSAEFVADALPPGYRWLERSAVDVSHVRVIAPDGLLAASGYAAASGGVFIYDRIFTAAAHRRRGLGRALMARLGSDNGGGLVEVLTATPAGRALYATLGWRAVSAWTTAAVIV